MKKSLWLQLFALSVLVSALTSAIFFTVFSRTAAAAMLETRRNIYVFLAQLVEEAPYAQSIERYARDPALGGGNVWVLSEDGKILAADTSEPPPREWLKLSKPGSAHAMSFSIPRLSHFATLVLIRLKANEPTYLLVRPSASSPARAVAKIEVWLFFGALLSATFTGLAMIVLYLRRTSLEARTVIAALRSNQLHARFSIRRFDKIAHLKLDFNAMADEIEQLVKRLRKTEAARRDLMQELGHDLRTPLTSLRTSIETLASYHEQITAEQRREFFDVVQSELVYFVRLLDDLFFIADIAEPRYRGARDTIRLDALLESEMLARRIAQPHIAWRLHCEKPLMLDGDAHLLLRLLRNALDNAAKYARTSIDIAARTVTNNIEIVVADDGCGINADAVKAFGERRKHRARTGFASLDMSLGLGSVIIKTIVELHGGNMRIRSAAIDPQEPPGTRFIFSFPKRLNW